MATKKKKTAKPLSKQWALGATARCEERDEHGARCTGPLGHQGSHLNAAGGWVEHKPPPADRRAMKKVAPNLGIREAMRRCAKTRTTTGTGTRCRLSTHSCERRSEPTPQHSHRSHAQGRQDHAGYAQDARAWTGEPRDARWHVCARAGRLEALPQ